MRTTRDTSIAVFMMIIVVCSTEGVVGNKRRSLHVEERRSEATKVTLVHVVSPYGIGMEHCKAKWCPFSQDQGVAFQSMLRAKQRAKTPVVLAATTTAEDKASLPLGFVKLPNLPRNTMNEWPRGNRKAPYVQDIFDSLLSTGVEFEYLVYTSPGTILHKDFYDVVLKHASKGWDAFTIRRQLISREDENGDLFYWKNLEKINNLKGDKDAGNDCFVIRRSFLQRIQMGDVIQGFGPWGFALRQQLIADKALFTVLDKLDIAYHFHEAFDPANNFYIGKNVEKIYETRRLWCLCAMRRVEDDGMCQTLYDEYSSQGYDITGACPQSEEIITGLYKQLELSQM